MLDDDNDTTPIEREGSSDEQVRPLGEDRYVVSLDDEADSPGADGIDSPSEGSNADAGRRLEDLDGAYAFELHARHENGADSRRVETNDVTDAFESLLRWYAGTVAPDTPPETVVETLLANSDLDLDGRR
jgi:hypothetical protein